MNLLQFIVTVVVLGVLMYFINAYIPMTDWAKKLLNVGVVIIVALWLLYSFGVFHYLTDIRVPK
jgi:hypothetical protein